MHEKVRLDFNWLITLVRFTYLFGSTWKFISRKYYYKCYQRTIDISTYQTCFIVRRLTFLVHLKDGQYKNFGIRLIEGGLVSPSDHLEELCRQIWIRIKLDIAGEYIERRCRFTRYITAYVHRVQQFLLVFIHL